MKSKIEKFEEKYQPVTETGCWLWIGFTLPAGYGKFGDMLAHRAAWEMFVGLIPEGLFVLHRCDTPSCVNPGHLFLGTHLQNMADMRAKDRQSREPRAGQGSENSQAKLSDDAIVEIRASTEKGFLLAKMFGVSAGLISGIRHGKRWAHIPG
jgi:hypothetical protein